MKKLLTTILLISTFSFVNGQDVTNFERVAITNQSKDTLYISEKMFDIITEAWEPRTVVVEGKLYTIIPDEPKPVFVSVANFKKYLLKRKNG